MKRWQKWASGIAVVFLVGIGFIAFILPGIVRSKAISAIEAETGRKAAIGRIALNPLTLTARVEGFRLLEPKSEAVFVSFSSVRVSLSPASLFRGAPVVREAHLTSPYVHLVRTAANRYNFSDLLEKKQPEPAKKAKKDPARFSLNNLTLANGSLDFVDSAPATERRHTIRNLEVAIPFISSIPYLADRYVQPRLVATVNGAPLRVEGKLRPFKAGAEAVYDVNLKDVSLPFYLAYYPGPPPIRLDSGSLSTSLQIIHRVAEGKEPEIEVTGGTVLAGLAVTDRAGNPLVALTRGEVKVDRAQVVARKFSIAAIHLDGLDTTLSRDRSGTWNFQRLTATDEKKPAPTETQGTKPVVEIASTRLANCRLRVADDLPPGGFVTEMRDIALDARGISTVAGKTGKYEFSFATSRDEKGKLSGEVTLDPLAVTTTVGCEGIALAAYYPYLADFLNGPISGRCNLSGNIVFRDKALSADKVELQFRDLATRFGTNEGLLFKNVAITGGHYSQKDNLLEFASITVAGGDLRFSRGADGTFSPITLLRKQPAGKPASAPPAAKKGPAFRYRTDRFSLTGLSAAFIDHKVEDSPTFTLRKGDLTIRNLVWPKRESMPITLSAGYGEKGKIAASVRLTPEPLALKGTLALQQISLTDFDAYLPENLLLTLADGSLDTELAFNLVKKGGQMTGSFSGKAGLRSFYALDAEGEDLLKWESLQLDGLKGNLSPFSLELAEVALNRFYSHIVINRDGRLNLQELYARPAPQPGAQPAPAPPAPAQPAPPAAGGAKTVKIGAVTLQDGTLDFADRHTSPEYATTMVNLGGRVSGLSSEESQFADVDLRGNLENHSPLRITGKINPLRDDLFVDLKVSFTDIELSPLTPYSGTYLGYTVDKGKLFLDLKYHIEKKSLDSTNKVFIDQFTFGKKVESDKATGLPVRLAVALLKDRKGEIHLDLPVTGRTDDPKFSIWGVILDILKNLLAKAATSPLALLQSAFGGKEDFSSIRFAPGSSRLNETERAKLASLATAMADRPALKLEVTGFVDREKDPEGYRNEQLTRKMKAEKFLGLVKEKKNQPGDSPDSMEVLPQEYSPLLTAVYRKEKFPKPRNVIGLVKDLPDDEMKKLILANTVVGPEDLKTLARDRAVSVRSYLVAEGKLPPERIFEKGGDIFKAPAKEGDAASRVEFGVAVQ